VIGDRWREISTLFSVGYCCSVFDSVASLNGAYITRIELTRVFTIKEMRKQKELSFLLGEISSKRKRNSFGILYSLLGKHELIRSALHKHHLEKHGCQM
jgi:hypothetical protein